MTSPVEFSTGEFRANQVWKVLLNGITNQEAKNKGFLESLTFLILSQEDKRKFCSQVAKELTLGPAPTA